MRNLARRSALSLVFVVWSFASPRYLSAEEPARTTTVVASKATAAGIALPKGMVKDSSPTAVPEPTALFIAGFAGCMLLVLAQRLRGPRPTRD
jgi:organic hydroperoxide reductase OsmC/OhrA